MNSKAKVKAKAMGFGIVGGKFWPVENVRGST